MIFYLDCIKLDCKQRPIKFILLMHENVMPIDRYHQNEYENLPNNAFTIQDLYRQTRELYCCSPDRFFPLISFCSRSFVIFRFIFKFRSKYLKPISNDCRSTLIHHCRRYSKEINKNKTFKPIIYSAMLHA